MAGQCRSSGLLPLCLPWRVHQKRRDGPAYVGKTWATAEKLADADGGSLNEVPQGESRRFQLTLAGLVIGFWEALRTPRASGVFDSLPVLSRRPVAGWTTWSRPRVALRSAGKTIQRRRGENSS